jgi:hypothetical protein
VSPHSRDDAFGFSLSVLLQCGTHAPASETRTGPRILKRGPDLSGKHAQFQFINKHKRGSRVSPEEARGRRHVSSEKTKRNPATPKYPKHEPASDTWDPPLRCDKRYKAIWVSSEGHIVASISVSRARAFINPIPESYTPIPTPRSYTPHAQTPLTPTPNPKRASPKA